MKWYGAQMHYGSMGKPTKNEFSGGISTADCSDRTILTKSRQKFCPSLCLPVTKIKKDLQYIHEFSMTSKPTVSDSRRLGSSAESEIESRLKNFSIPAKPDPDIGIDFYCQLLEGEIASSKFFGVQAKGTKHFNNYWRQSFKRKTIELWLQLPFPVFIIVYDENSGNCYWKSIVHNRNSLIEKLRTNAKTISIRIEKSHSLEKGGNKNEEFIRKIKEAQSLISLICGRPQFGEGYVRTLPIVYLSKGIITNLRENIRTSMKFLINNRLLTNDIENAYFLCDFLTRFDKGHYDHFVTFGRINKFLGKKKEAKESFEEAIKICKGDKNWNRLKASSDPTIEEIIASIKKEIETMERSD